MWWAAWLIAGPIGLLCWWLIGRLGNQPFWKLVAKNPDAAFIFFKVEKCWFLDEMPTGVARGSLAGPYQLFVPSIGRQVTVWGLHPDYLESEERFVKGFGQRRE